MKIVRNRRRRRRRSLRKQNNKREEQELPLLLPVSDEPTALSAAAPAIYEIARKLGFFYSFCFHNSWALEMGWVLLPKYKPSNFT